MEFQAFLHGIPMAANIDLGTKTHSDLGLAEIQR
jgi:hypothetical protein